MSFVSPEFSFFLPTVLVVYFLLRKNYIWQNYFLIIASYLFYASWDWRFSLLMVWITLFDYTCAGIMSRCSEKYRVVLVYLSVCSDLSILGIFKYFSFFEDSLVEFLSLFHLYLPWEIVHITLPIGISFIVFESMSYTIDVYRRHMKAEFSLVSYALFVSFFPKLVAGPIIRAQTLLRQIQAPRVVNIQKFKLALYLILIGYFLKLIVSNNISGFVDTQFSSKLELSGLTALLSLYGFAFQIFSDFAGYSSIAIGIALLLGFSLPVNFRQPYLVTNPQDFWRNWHISLSTWLRDYLYVSLGGSRAGKLATYRNLFLTMLLGGLWHGASWTFVFWGAYQGGLLMAHRAFVSGKNSRTTNRAIAFIGVIGMFQLTCIGWLLFRARDLEQVKRFAGALAHGWGVADPNSGTATVLVCVSGIIVIGYQLMQRWLGDDLSITHPFRRFQMMVFLGLYFSILWFGNFGTNTFIYFQF